MKESRVGLRTRPAPSAQFPSPVNSVVDEASRQMKAEGEKSDVEKRGRGAEERWRAVSSGNGMGSATHQ